MSVKGRGKTLLQAKAKASFSTMSCLNAVLIGLQFPHIGVGHVEGGEPLDAEGRAEDGFDVGPTRFPAPVPAFLLQSLDAGLVFANRAQLRKAHDGGENGEEECFENEEDD